jgi:uncharacterized protein
MMEPLNMRPHHGVCFHFFDGKGYSDEFVQSMTSFSRRLKENPECKITLKSDTDFLCKSCPHNIDGVCGTEEKVAEYDNRCLTFCGLSDGDILSWQEFQKLVMRKILLPGFLSALCGDCCWSDICQHGIVENAVNSVEK